MNEEGGILKVPCILVSCHVVHMDPCWALHTACQHSVQDAVYPVYTE